MGKIYKNQTALRFVLNTKVDLTGALELKIYYKKPRDNIIGNWPGIFTSSTKIYYDVENSSILDVSGLWLLRSYVRFDHGEVFGNIVQIYIFEIWDV